MPQRLNVGTGSKMKEIQVVQLCSGLTLHVDFNKFKSLSIETEKYIFLVTEDRIACRNLVITENSLKKAKVDGLVES